jgi:hydroxymethylpyrimidine pyrophosphatase-like HAD family hydrolase
LGRFQALAIDLDGTLFSSDETVSAGNAAALRRAEKAGLRVLIASARWYQIAERVAREVGSRDPVIACSGAQVRRTTDEHDLLDLRLPMEFAREAGALLDGLRSIVTAPLDDDVLIKFDGELAGLAPELRRVESIAGSLDVPPRIIHVQGTEACQVIEGSLMAAWQDRVRFMESFSSRGKRILTLTAAGADKGAALAVACAEMGIPTDSVIAFGDSEVDLEMFRVAGASVAMGQAPDDVKAVASYVSARHDENGVAVAIDALLSGEWRPV